MPNINAKTVADYLKTVIADFERDDNTTRMLRRLRLKEVHLRRNGRQLRRERRRDLW